MKKIFCFPALELFHCLPLWKTELFVSSRAFLLSTPTFLLSTHVENSEATWKKATKCNKLKIQGDLVNYLVKNRPDCKIQTWEKRLSISLFHVQMRLVFKKKNIHIF